MNAERPVEHKPASPAQRSAELIITRLSDYLSIRFDLAVRINPQLRVIKQDLMYHELANVRRCLVGDKIYGPVRQVVAEVFLGDDEKRRRGVMSPTDQTSIQVELVSHCQDERSEHTRGQIRIHDLKSFYAAIDPDLSGLIDLIETWIWWDIADAAELVRFEQKLGLLTLVRQGRLPEDLRKRYAALIHVATGAEEDEKQASTVTDEDVMRYEFKQLTHIRDQWIYRRQGERGYMYVLKRDEMPPANQGERIHQIAAWVREYDALEQLDEIDEAFRHRYAVDLRLPPDQVTKDGVLEFLQGQMVVIEREMLRQTDDDARLGPPYNYKERQLEQMSKWLLELEQQLRAAVKPAAPAASEAPSS